MALADENSRVLSSFEEGEGAFCFVALTYVMTPPALGEQKSKPAQLNLKMLGAAGIHPHIIACRAAQPVTNKVREKIAMFASVPMERVFSMHDRDTVYVVPEMLRGAGIDAAVTRILGIDDRIDESRGSTSPSARLGFVRSGVICTTAMDGVGAR